MSRQTHSTMEFARHPDTWLELNQLGKEPRPYHPTILGFGRFINDQHLYYYNCPTKGACIDIGVDGWLRQADALKLYEMAYYAVGDILEFGTNRGLSTSILARAVRDAGKSTTIVTMELDSTLAEQARATLTKLNLSQQVDFMVGDADASCQTLISRGREFSFAFVDHSHAYNHVIKACHRLPALLPPGSFCLFHDFNDPREGAANYGVYSAVRDGLDRLQFEFCGIYGCCGLFRKRDS